MTPAEDDQIIRRCSELARAALRGDEVGDGDPDDLQDRGFGAAAYAVIQATKPLPDETGPTELALAPSDVPGSGSPEEDHGEPAAAWPTRA